MKEQYNILIVDDEKIVRDSLFHWFEEEGRRTPSAACGSRCGSPPRPRAEA